MINFTVTTVLLFFTTLISSAVHGWNINNPTAVLLSPPISSSSRYCSTINNNAVVDVLLVRRRRQSRRLFVLSAISTSSSTSTTTEPIEDCDQQHGDYDECIIDEDRLLSDCAELESFINSASTASTATAAAAISDTTPTPTVTASTSSTATATMDTIYEQLHDDKGKSLLSTIIIPIPKNTDEDTESSTTTDSTATAIGRSRSRPATPARPYYEFNKLIVNTMYNIISFLYRTDADRTADKTDDYTMISLSHKQQQQIQQQQRLQKNYEHFYILEIIARVPYFAYLSCMHLQETFGSRYSTTDINTTVDSNTTDSKNYDNTADQVRIEKMRLFYAQADNELHHLLIIEDLLLSDKSGKSLSLSSNKSENNNNKEKKDNSSSSSVSSIDHRTIIAHSLATLYYWYTVFVYMTHGKVGEQAAYHLNELFVDRAYDTYNSFITQNENELKKTISSSTSTASVSNNNVVPDIAHKYYDTDNQYLLNLLYSSSSSTSSNNDKQPNSKPPLSNLYDVFMNIRNDEKEHYNTLCKLQQEQEQ